jgi:hypothetical protein
MGVVKTKTCVHQRAWLVRLELATYLNTNTRGLDHCLRCFLAQTCCLYDLTNQVGYVAKDYVGLKRHTMSSTIESAAFFDQSVALKPQVLFKLYIVLALKIRSWDDVLNLFCGQVSQSLKQLKSVVKVDQTFKRLLDRFQCSSGLLFGHVGEVAFVTCRFVEFSPGFEGGLQMAT